RAPDPTAAFVPPASTARRSSSDVWLLAARRMSLGLRDRWKYVTDSVKCESQTRWIAAPTVLANAGPTAEAGGIARLNAKSPIRRHIALLARAPLPAGRSIVSRARLIPTRMSSSAAAQSSDARSASTGSATDQNAEDSAGPAPKRTLLLSSWVATGNEVSTDSIR